MTAEFETWLADRLVHFNADGEVFSSYILGILDSEESSEEKETNLCDLLEGLGLDDGSPDPCPRLQREIWCKWSDIQGSSSSLEQASGAAAKSDLGAVLVAHAESQTKAYAASKGLDQRSANDKDRQAVKAAILAQYNNVVEHSDEDESDGDEEHNEFENTNAENVAKAHQEQREKSKAAAQAKKEKDKEDREKQKKETEDRKKKAQDKAAKGERKR